MRRCVAACPLCLNPLRCVGSDPLLDCLRSAAQIRLSPPRRFTLEEALAYLADDELMEATPTNIRMRKGMLKADDRKRAARGK